MIATAPGKLILSGEYAVLDGAPAIVIAVDRRAIARRNVIPRGSSPFLLAVADEIAQRRGSADPATQAALEISVDSTAFYDRVTPLVVLGGSATVAAIALGSIAARRGPSGARTTAELSVDGTKLGLGSSAAVTVAATALALGSVDRDEVLAVALAAHAKAQGPRGARGSGADVAASVYGGTIVFSLPGGTGPCRVERRHWPAAVAIAPFFTGAAADTPQLVAQVNAARASNRTAVEAALAAITSASHAACAALTAPPDIAPVALIGALAVGANAMDRLAIATSLDLVPACVTRARAQLARLGGTAKTTGAGGGDVGIAVFPATVDPGVVTRALIEAGCQPLRISLDEAGVDLRADAS